MRTVWHRRNQRIVEITYEQWSLGGKKGVPSPELAMLALRTAGSMLDESLFERHKIQTGPDCSQHFDVEVLNELHALLIFRAIYGQNPPEQDLVYTHDLLSWPAES
jgi:hypothetical protein